MKDLYLILVCNLMCFSTIICVHMEKGFIRKMEMDWDMKMINYLLTFLKCFMNGWKLNQHQHRIHWHNKAVKKIVMSLRKLVLVYGSGQTNLLVYNKLQTSRLSFIRCQDQM